MALGSNLKKPVKETQRTTNRAAEKESVVEGVTNTPNSKFDDDIWRDTDVAESTELMCVFQSGTSYYAIPIALTKEVVKLKKMAPIPQMPEYILGLANVRGTIYGVLDLAVFFGNGQGVTAGGTFLLVLNNEKYKIAIAIPTVPDTLHVSESMKDTGGGSLLKSVKKREYVQGIIKKDDRLIIQLNILEMITSASFVNVSEQQAIGQ